MNGALHIVYASDERYLKYLSVTIGSAFLWASDRKRLIVDVLTLNVKDCVWEKWMEEMTRHLPFDCRIVKHEIDEDRLGDGLRLWHGSLATYARLLLPTVLSDTRWCVYADVDTLFTDDPLKLFDVFVSTCSIMGHLECYAKSLIPQREWFGNRNLPFRRESYFCAGFILINLTYFREYRLEEQAFEFLEKYRDAPLLDQDALNVVCSQNSKALPFAWGCFGNEAFMEGRPSAIHYPGHNPWTFMDNMFPDYIDAYNIWYKYARFIFGQNYSYYSGDKRYCKYVLMRVLGWCGQLLNRLFSILNFWDIKFIGRYVKRHYASHKVWKSMLSCIQNRSDWRPRA